MLRPRGHTCSLREFRSMNPISALWEYLVCRCTSYWGFFALLRGAYTRWNDYGRTSILRGLWSKKSSTYSSERLLSGALSIGTRRACCLELRSVRLFGALFRVATYLLPVHMGLELVLNFVSSLAPSHFPFPSLLTGKMADAQSTYGTMVVAKARSNRRRTLPRHTDYRSILSNSSDGTVTRRGFSLQSLRTWLAEWQQIPHLRTVLNMIPNICQP